MTEMLRNDGSVPEPLDHVCKAILTVCYNRIWVVVLELLFHIFHTFAFQKTQEGKDEDGEDRGLNKLIDHHFDDVRLGKWLFRWWNLTIQQKVVKVIPRGFETTIAIVNVSDNQENSQYAP